MHAVRGLSLIVHVLALVLGTYIAGAAVANAAADSIGVDLSRAVSVVVLIVLVLAYWALLIWRGFTPIAPLIFVVSLPLAAGFAFYARTAVEPLIGSVVLAAGWAWVRHKSQLPRLGPSSVESTFLRIW